MAIGLKSFFIKSAGCTIANQNRLEEPLPRETDLCFWIQRSFQFAPPLASQFHDPQVLRQTIEVEKTIDARARE
jgi:hypothetical protein